MTSSESQTTPLGARLRALIEAGGPLSVFDFMGLCLADPEHGYYMRAEPFGADGDFITAPEVSQFFGELVGAWVIEAHAALGSPRPFHLVELGPGRGTLMADMLRVAALRPAFREAAAIHLVETSRRLREIQRTTLGEAAMTAHWHDRIADLPEGAPLIVVANEFFDALPIRQYVRTAQGWRERAVGLDEQGALRFVAGTGSLDPGSLPAGLAGAAEGTILETQPLANALMEELGARIARQGGVLLAIDYGYARTASGETLQALRAHRHVPVLAEPGRADLTAHVNFEALARAARSAGLRPRALMTQGDFLLGLGLLERAGQVGAGRSPQEQERIRGEVERLAAPQEMGELFKVLAVAAPDVVLPLFDGV